VKLVNDVRSHNLAGGFSSDRLTFRRFQDLVSASCIVSVVSFINT
jgi:hypothetical protein